MGLKYLLPLLLTGCASVFDNPAAFEATQSGETMTVTWKTAGKGQMADICKIPNALLDGCAVVNHKAKTCTIYTHRFTTEEFVGHEVRHCFYGAFHD